MLQINDDMNDELFRRAAESYPLKTDNADWDTVLSKINAGGAADDPVFPAKKRKHNYRFLLLLLLLIPLIIFENIKSPLNNIEYNKTINGAETITTEIKNEDSLLNNKSNTFLQTDQSATQSLSDQSGQRLQTKSGSQNTGSIAGNPVEETYIAKKKQFYTTDKKSKINIKNTQATGDDQQMTEPALAKADKYRKKIKGNSSIAIKEGIEENIDIANKQIATADNNLVQQKDIENKISVNIPDKISDPVAKTDSIKDNTKISTAITTQEKVNKKNKVEEKKEKISGKKHFYAGAIIGPDFSTIKMQSIKKTGLSYGFLLGYRINRKWNIETGLIQDRKYYSTDGKYFNTKDLNYPPAYKIEYVTGVCKMMELPVNISYTFYQRNRSGLFASMGVSAFFMQHESYIYDMNYYGNRYSRAYEYDNKSKSIPAIVNISAGYTYKLGNIGNLRVEPYIKLPISKIGTGKLPIQSGGVFIVFTKDIF